MATECITCAAINPDMSRSCLRCGGELRLSNAMIAQPSQRLAPSHDPAIVVRRGNRLVAHWRGLLPAICVKCGQSTRERFLYELTWTPRNRVMRAGVLGLLTGLTVLAVGVLLGALLPRAASRIAGGVAARHSIEHEVEIPLCHWHSKTPGLIYGLSLFFIVVSFPWLMYFLLRYFLGDISAVALALPVIVLVVMMTVHRTKTAPLRIVDMDANNYVYYKGAGRAFLEQLPRG